MRLRHFSNVDIHLRVHCPAVLDTAEGLTQFSPKNECVIAGRVDQMLGGEAHAESRG